MEFKDVLNKEIIVGFGRDNQRLVVLPKEGNGTTFFAGEKKIEQAPYEEMSCKISPGYCLCIGGSFSPHLIGFQLGRNRMLAASYYKKNQLTISYLPDEIELAADSSEFMSKCGNRGIW